MNGLIRISARWFRNSLFLVGLVTVGGAALRLYGLDAKSLWLDEATMYWVSHGSTAQVIASNAALQSSPPLYAILTNLVSLLGDSEFILRFPSWLAGVAAIPAMYWLARQFLAKPASYFSAVVVALSVTQIQYSQELREYSFTFLTAILMIVFFCRFLRQPALGNEIGLALSWSIGVFLQYGLGLLAVALNGVMVIALVFRRERKSLLARWFVVQLIVLAAVFMVYQLALAQQLAAWPTGPGASVTSEHLDPAYWDGTVVSLGKLVVSNTSRLLYFAYPNLYMLVFVLAIGSMAALGSANGRLALLLAAFPIAVTFAAALVRKYPYDGIRQDMFLLPTLYILAAFGFDYVWNADRRRIASSAFALVLAFGAVTPAVNYFKSRPEDIRSVVAVLASSYAPGDYVYVYYGGNPAFRYYYRNNVDKTVFGVESRDRPENYYPVLDQVLANRGPLWLVFSHCYNDECKQIADYVAQSRKTTKLVDADDVALYRADEAPQ